MGTIKKIGRIILFIMYWLLWPKGVLYNYFGSLKPDITYGAKNASI